MSEDSIKADFKGRRARDPRRKPEQPKPRRIQIDSGERATIEGKASEK